MPGILYLAFLFFISLHLLRAVSLLITYSVLSLVSAFLFLHIRHTLSPFNKITTTQLASSTTRFDSASGTVPHRSLGHKEGTTITEQWSSFVLCIFSPIPLHSQRRHLISQTIPRHSSGPNAFEPSNNICRRRKGPGFSTNTKQRFANDLSPDFDHFVLIPSGPMILPFAWFSISPYPILFSQGSRAHYTCFSPIISTHHQTYIFLAFEEDLHRRRHPQETLHIFATMDLRMCPKCCGVNEATEFMRRNSSKVFKWCSRCRQRGRDVSLSFSRNSIESTSLMEATALQITQGTKEH